MKKNIKRKTEKEFPVREGTEDGSITGKENINHKNKYPLEEEKDKQADNQPEFIEPQRNKKAQ